MMVFILSVSIYTLICRIYTLLSPDSRPQVEILHKTLLSPCPSPLFKPNFDWKKHFTGMQ